MAPPRTFNFTRRCWLNTPDEGASEAAPAAASASRNRRLLVIDSPVSTATVTEKKRAPERYAAGEADFFALYRFRASSSAWREDVSSLSARSSRLRISAVGHSPFSLASDNVVTQRM